jgi:hypothetical protein
MANELQGSNVQYFDQDQWALDIRKNATTLADRLGYNMLDYYRGPAYNATAEALRMARIANAAAIADIALRQEG